MSVSFSLESKNTYALTYESKASSLTWNEATMTWDESDPGTWDAPLLFLSKESKNNASLSYENKP